MSARQRVWGLALSSAFVLAVACGSSDSKSTRQTSDAGAAGANDAGAPSAAGSPNTAGGPAAAGEAGGAGEAPTGESGAAGTPAAEGGSAGELPSGEAGAPQCLVDGYVDNLQIVNEVYQGCRGSRVQFSFKGDADEDFTCCAAISGNPSVGLSMIGETNNDGGGRFHFQVPSDAPLGSAIIAPMCDDSADQSFTLEVVEGMQPIVLSISAEVSPTSNMVIAGKNLSSVTAVSGVRFDGQRYDCTFKPDQKTDTKLSCDFGGKIPLSANEQQSFVLEVYSDPCGYAVDQPFFWVVESPT